MTTADDREELPEADRLHLDEKGYDYEVRAAGGELDVIIHKFPLPPAYEPRECDLLLRLPVGYPNAKADMFWTTPGVQLAKGGTPQAADQPATYAGRSWQRWSRHFGGWRPGVDGVRSYLAAVRKELDKGI